MTLATKMAQTWIGLLHKRIPYFRNLCLQYFCSFLKFNFVNYLIFLSLISFVFIFFSCAIVPQPSFPKQKKSEKWWWCILWSREIRNSWMIRLIATGRELWLSSSIMQLLRDDRVLEERIASSSSAGGFFFICSLYFLVITIDWEFKNC